MADGKDDARAEYEVQVKLHINEQMYRKDYISKDLYEKAKNRIIKGGLGKRNDCNWKPQGG